MSCATLITGASSAAVAPPARACCTASWMSAGTPLMNTPAASNTVSADVTAATRSSISFAMVSSSSSLLVGLIERVLQALGMRPQVRGRGAQLLRIHQERIHDLEHRGQLLLDPVQLLRVIFE